MYYRAFMCAQLLLASQTVQAQLLRDLEPK